ncbi:GntR family transcriptional regulator, partial [Paenibacillus polymyxa]|nr:GntR family transcriptional regulator [Paenibacillus polymyxa]
MRERILQGEFPPGTRLNERALCDLLGVSRTPLREAFRLLAAEGLVHGPAPSSVGQEGGAVGSVLARGAGDKIKGSHRGHPQFLA